MTKYYSKVDKTTSCFLSCRSSHRDVDSLGIGVHLEIECGRNTSSRLRTKGFHIHRGQTLGGHQLCEEWVFTIKRATARPRSLNTHFVPILVGVNEFVPAGGAA